MGSSRSRSPKPSKGGSRDGQTARQQVRRRFGNRAMGRLLAGLSTPSFVGNLSRMRGLMDQPGERAEARATETARRHSTGGLTERGSTGGPAPKKRATRRPDFGPLAGTAFARTLSSGGGGRAISRAVRAPIEKAIDTDLGDVRIHDDSRAARLSRSMRARAFTVGRDIYVDREKADINTRSGREIVRHELTHAGQNKGSPKAGRPGATIQRAHAVSRRDGWDMKHTCYSDILDDGKPLKDPFKYGLAHVAAVDDAEYGGHAWLAFERFDLMDDPSYGEWVYADTLWTDLVWGEVRLSTEGDAIKKIKDRMSDPHHMGRTFEGVPTRRILNAVNTAKSIAGRYVGKRKKKKGDAKDALYYKTAPVKKSDINCAKYVEAVLGAAGIDASAGRFVKTPNQIASGKTMHQIKQEKKGGGGKKKPFGS